MREQFERAGSDKKETGMLWTLSVIFFSLWLVGIGTRSSLHGYLHILLVFAGATLVAGVVGRKKRSLD